MQRMLRVRAAKREAARRRAAVLSIQKAKRGRAERAERSEAWGDSQRAERGASRLPRPRSPSANAEALERLLGSSPPGAHSGRTALAPPSTAHRKSAGTGGASSEGRIERPDGKPIGRRSPSGGLKHVKVDPAKQSTR